MRWTGAPGFFEIWFLVVFEPGAARAWWLRYTTFAPVPGQPGTPRATLWAAAFDTGASPPAVAAKAILPLAEYDRGGPDRFRIRLGPATLENGRAEGAVRSAAHAIAWDLRFTPAATAARRTPRLLERLPLPTRVAHANTDVACSGWVAVDGVRRELRDAPAVQKHLWGTRRVEELLWLYCPRFEGDPAARLEATAVRLRRRGVRLAPVWARDSEGEHDRCGLPAVIANHVETPHPGEIAVRAVSAKRAVTARAWCDPRMLVGYVYRDPHGWDVHVAQSDVASCELVLRTRPHPLAAWGSARRLVAPHGAALEIHHLEPLPGVRYIAWDDTELPR